MTPRTSRATRVPGAPALAARGSAAGLSPVGGAITGTKYALRAFDPVTLLSVELVAATAALWAVLLIRAYRPPPSWSAAVLLEPALAYPGETFGLSMTSATDGAIISGLESALVVILAALVLGEAISRAGIVAVVAGLAGLVVLTGGGGRSTAAGDLCIVGSVLCASLYSVVAKRFADDSDALSLTTWQFTAATAVALAVATARWAGHPDQLPIAVIFSARDCAAAPGGFERQAPAAGDAGGRDPGQHLGHVRLDRFLSGGSGDRDAVVTVLDEVQVAHAVDVDRRDRHAAPPREIEPLPPLPHPVGGGPEPAVEVAPGLDGSGHGVERDGLQAKVVPAAPA